MKLRAISYAAIMQRATSLTQTAETKILLNLSLLL